MSTDVLGAVDTHPAPLRHALAVYDSQDDLVAQVILLARAALGRGEPVALGLQPDTLAVVQDAVGHPANLIVLDHPDRPEGRSGQTLAAARARRLRGLVADAGRATVITEHCDRFDGPDGRFWTELDVAVTIAMADLPLDITCFFPAAPQHPSVLDGARRTHELLSRDGERLRNPLHRGPVDVLADTPVPAPPELRPPDLTMPFQTRELVEVRTVIGATLRAAAIASERAEDIALAVNEVATNAVQHGSGQARFSLWSGPDGHVFEVHDSGTLREPLPGLRAPHPGQRHHRGLWIARQLCDCLHIWTDERGTHVRIHTHTSS